MKNAAAVASVDVCMILVAAIEVTDASPPEVVRTHWLIEPDRVVLLDPPSGCSHQTRLIKWPRGVATGA